MLQISDLYMLVESRTLLRELDEVMGNMLDDKNIDVDIKKFDKYKNIQRFLEKNS